MASNKNILSELLSSSPNFFSQLVFGFILAVIANFAGASLILSLFLGIIGGVTLGWFTSVNETNPQIPDVASNDGIDSALKYWLVFMFSFVFLGYSAPISILFGGMAAFGGGWIIAWWRSKEKTQTQLSNEIPVEEITEESTPRVTRKKKRLSSPRIRRASGSFNFRFWQR
jgi:predicted ribosomally synthesized peptide with SipW-like signal peptide